MGVRWLRALMGFQFTPLREGRRVPYSAVLDVSPISIHAPPRGATRVIARRHLDVYFNSRPSARGDEAVIIKPAFFHKFQFTPLREGRPRFR